MKKNINQRGIAFIPILLWSAVIIIGVLVGQDAVKRGYISISNPTTPTETAQPTYTPVPTAEPYIPTPKPSVYNPPVKQQPPQVNPPQQTTNAPQTSSAHSACFLKNYNDAVNCAIQCQNQSTMENDPTLTKMEQCAYITCVNIQVTANNNCPP